VKRKREEDEKKRKEQEGNISKYFTNVAATGPAKPKPRNTAEDAAFLAGILGDFDDVPARAPTIKKKRTEEPVRKARRLSPPVQEKTPKPKKPSRFNDDDEDNYSYLPSAIAAPRSPPTNKFIQLHDGFLNDNLDSDIPMMSDAPIPPSSPTRKFARYSSPKKESDDEDNDIAMAEIDDHGVKAEAVNYSATRPAPKVEPKIEPKPMPDALEWTSVTAKLQTSTFSAADSGPIGKLQGSDVLLDDGTLDFFWIDAVEVRGSLCLFGKVRIISTP
jgi:DNA polymerase alpha subunit A